MNGLMSKRRYVIRKKDIFFFIGWVLIFSPPILFHISGGVTSIIRTLNIVYSVLLLILFIQSGKRFQRFITVKCLIVMAVWELLIVVIQSYNQLEVFFSNMLLPPLEVFLLVSCIWNGNKEEPKKMFCSLIFMSKLYILIDMFSIVLFPKGIISTSLGSSIERANWFLGSKNNQTTYLLLAALVLTLFAETKPEKRKALVYNILALLSAVFTDEFGVNFMGGSSTGIVSISFVFIFSLLYYLFGDRELFKVKPIWIYLVAIIVNIITVTGFVVPYIQNLVETVLGKSATFSNRTLIWERVMYYINQNPIIGYGEQQIWFAVRLSSVLEGTTYVYNMILKIILDFGLIGFLFFSIPIIRMKKAETRQGEVLLIGLAAFFIAGLMTEVGLEYIFLIMFMFDLLTDRDTNVIPYRLFVNNEIRS